jgi:hypothetical protein
MKDARRIVLTAVSSLALATTVWAANPPDMPRTRQDASKEQSSNQLQSVNGKIASVEKDSFTLSVATNQWRHNPVSPRGLDLSSRILRKPLLRIQPAPAKTQ